MKANWALASATQATEPGEVISRSGYSTRSWHPVHQVPATVLEILEEDGTYPNLYYGENLLRGVPQDLYQQNWWYRTSFIAPARGQIYWLDLPGINYRAEIWLNGKRIADGRQIHDNNYVTVFPGETTLICGTFNTSGLAGAMPWLRVEGYNSPKQLAPIP